MSVQALLNPAMFAGSFARNMAYMSMTKASEALCLAAKTVDRNVVISKDREWLRIDLFSERITEMIQLYRITRTGNGKQIGKFMAEDEFGALDAWANLVGYPTFSELADREGFDNLRVEEDIVFDYAAAGREAGEESVREHAETNQLTQAEVRWLLGTSAETFLRDHSDHSLSTLMREENLDPIRYQREVYRNAYVAAGMEFLEKIAEREEDGSK